MVLRFFLSCFGVGSDSPTSTSNPAPKSTPDAEVSPPSYEDATRDGPASAGAIVIRCDNVSQHDSEANIVDGAIASLQLITFDGPRNTTLKRIQQKLTSITGPQAKAILGSYIFDGPRSIALEIIKPKLASITDQEREDILGLYKFDGPRMKASRVLNP